MDVSARCLHAIGHDLRPGLLPAVVTSVGVPRSPRTGALHASSLQTGMRRMLLGGEGQLLLDEMRGVVRLLVHFWFSADGEV